jgi:hypothetical protein
VPFDAASDDRLEPALRAFTDDRRQASEVWETRCHHARERRDELLLSALGQQDVVGRDARLAAVEQLANGDALGGDGEIVGGMNERW